MALPGSGRYCREGKREISSKTMHKCTRTKKNTGYIFVIDKFIFLKSYWQGVKQYLGSIKGGTPLVIKIVRKIRGYIQKA
jgi:hypothetical protein